jgi:flagellar protein FlaG
MDGIANVAKQQSTQVNTSEVQGRAAQQAQPTQTKTTTEVVKQMAQEAEHHGTKINSADQVKDLVDQLNKALSPMNTNVKFGVDSQDVFFVSVIESETSKLIRRFPAEQAADFLPKMQEVTGMLFDTHG